MKSALVLIATGILTFAASAQDLNLPSNKIVMDFYSTPSLSDLQYNIQYPSGPIAAIRNGREGSRHTKHGDCMALIYSSFQEITTDQMMSLAQSLNVREGYIDLGLQLTPQVINGTVVFELPNYWYYVTRIQVQTRDGLSFVANRERILGPKQEGRIRMKYVPNCSEVAD